MGQPTRIYIFATAIKPDPYVNALVYWLRSDSVTSVTFVCIHEHNYHLDRAQAQAARITSGVRDLLETLASGQYVCRDGQIVALTATEIEIYAAALDKLQYLTLTSAGIRWTELQSKVQEFRRNGRAAFDVTALKKNLLVDVTSLLLSEGESEIFSFELRRDPTFDSRDLFAALGPDDYRYRCLAESMHVDAAMRRMVARSVTFRTVVWVTVALIIPVVLIQLYLPNSWAASVFVGLGSAVSLASWFFTLRQR